MLSGNARQLSIGHVRRELRSRFEYLQLSQPVTGLDILPRCYINGCHHPALREAQVGLGTSHQGAGPTGGHGQASPPGYGFLGCSGRSSVCLVGITLEPARTVIAKSADRYYEEKDQGNPGDPFALHQTPTL